MQTFRAFLALDLPDPTRDTLEALSDETRAGRAVPWENLHLTLHFLGEQPTDLLEEAHARLSALSLPAPDLEFDGLGGFGTPARSIAALVKPNTVLSALHTSTATALRRAGITPEKRRFRPHVTILRTGLRAGRPSPVEESQLHRFLTTFAGKSLPPFRPETLTLYRSTLRADGPVYDPLASYDLT